ncbi:hypothetical protein R5R35_007703 [Gryllus longicercus]|uniref:Cytochrome P450 n=1 Tax=Gryllus longicercus TaxID=2509291 RepID=A0AAN9VCX3_9ORTH
MITLILGVFIALLVIRLYRQAYERPQNFPPGPPRLPVWGSYWLLLLQNYRFMHKATLDMARRYKTRLLGLYLGQFPTVVATAYEDVRDVLTRPEFAARPDLLHGRLRAGGDQLGIFFNNGPAWMEQKRFMLRNMRDFGFGRRYKSMEETLREETEELIALGRGEWTDELSVRDGCMHFPTALYPGLVNLVWSMMTGQRFSRDQYGALRELSHAAAHFVRNLDQLGGAVTYTPWLHKIAPHATGTASTTRYSKVMSDTVQRALEEHEGHFSEDHLRDFIDRYIHEMRKEGRGKEFSFTAKQLQIVGADILLASSTTTTSTLSFAVRALLHHPEVLRRCQKELDEVVGQCRLPTLDDRPNMPFIEATLRETMRFNTLLPMGLPHLALEDTTLGGYAIPKNTLLACNLHAMHHDKELWGDPENFRPDRFLDERGELTKDITMPFGGGKRVCPGETFSRQSMFVLFAALLQHFDLRPQDPGALPPIDQMVNGISVTPEPFWARITPRF